MSIIDKFECPAVRPLLLQSRFATTLFDKDKTGVSYKNAELFYVDSKGGKCG